MKISTYTSCIKVASRHTIIYNSFTGRFIVVRDHVWDTDKLKEIVCGTTQESFHRQLRAAGVMIDDDTDEYTLLRDRIEQADNNSHEFILHINPTLDCNFRCWYCYENHISGSEMKEGTIKATESLIFKILSNPKIQTLNLGFFGGEPLLYFHKIARPIIEHTASVCTQLDKKLHVHFTSNGALLNDRIIDYMSQYNCGFQITLDGDREMHARTRFYKNGEGSVEKIVGNILKLLSAGLTVIVRINYTSSNIDSISSMKQYFETVSTEQKRYLQFDFQRVWQDKEREDDTEEKIKNIRNSFSSDGFLVCANYLARDIRESCYGDKVNHAIINYNGDVFGCTARDFTPQNRIGILDPSGRIVYDKEIYARRMNSKFTKPICHKCRIAPICGGGCRQRALDAVDSPYCSMGYSEEDIDSMITDIFEYTFALKP